MFSEKQTELQSTLIDDQLKVDKQNGGGGLEYSANGQYDTLRESICISLVFILITSIETRTCSYME